MPNNGSRDDATSLQRRRHRPLARAYTDDAGQTGTVSAQASVTSASPPALTVSATTITAGQSVTVTRTIGAGGNQDWLAFAPVGAANNSYVQFPYLGGRVTTRTWTVTAPTTPGVDESGSSRTGRSTGWQRARR